MNSKLILGADGDSWAAYPKLMMTGGGLADHLAARLGARLINISRDGDSSQETFGLPNKTRIIDVLRQADAFLLSSGGDDFAGPQFRLAVRENTGSGVANAVNWAWFNAALDLIIEDYREMRRLRDLIAPHALIISHSYGYPPPEMMGKGVLWYGPWLQPGFVDRGWKSPTDQAAIIKSMLVEFERRLAEFAAADPLHLHVNLQPILTPAHWGNELHLNSAGWDEAAEEIATEMQPWLDHLAVAGSQPETQPAQPETETAETAGKAGSPPAAPSSPAAPVNLRVWSDL
jgi:hypothetical protein